MLAPDEFLRAAQHCDGVNRRGEQTGIGAERDDGDLCTRLRYRQGKSVDGAVLAGCEAKIGSAELEIGLRFAKRASGKSAKRTVGIGDAFTEFDPRLAAVDTLAVDLHPGADLVKHLQQAIVQRTIRPDGDVYQVTAIARDDLKHVKDERARAVDEVRPVEPIAHRIFADPRSIGLNGFGNAA